MEVLKHCGLFCPKRKSLDDEGEIKDTKGEGKRTYYQTGANI
jgi:hypothetical protein